MSISTRRPSSGKNSNPIRSGTHLRNTEPGAKRVTRRSIRDWILWSPKRFAIVVAVTLAVVAVCATVTLTNVTVALLSSSPGSKGSPSSQAGVPDLGTTPHPDVPRQTDDGYTLADITAATDTGRKFLTSWLSASSQPSDEAWAKTLAPTASLALQPLLRLTPRHTVPSASLTSFSVDPSLGRLTGHAVLSDGTRLELKFVRDNLGGWRVDEFAPAR